VEKEATGYVKWPTADRRFRRSETLRAEVPAPDGAAPSARLLDRTGKAMPVPVASAVRDDADGSRWQTAQLALVPWRREITSWSSRNQGAGRAGGAMAANQIDEHGTLVAFRVVP
jgi:hypothetical protein